MKRIGILTVMCLFLLSVDRALALSFQDGQIHTISSEVQQLIVDYQYPNACTTVKLVSGGHIYKGDFYGKSQYLQSGGTLGYSTFFDQSKAYISGGSMHRCALLNEAQLFISGSDGCASLGLIDSSRLTLYGNDLIIQSIGFLKTFGPGTYILSDFQITTNSFGLTSHLLNGQIFSTHFSMSETAQIVVIPEPATMLLLGLGGLLIRRKN